MRSAILSYDDNAADLLYEVINRRYEHRSLDCDYQSWVQGMERSLSQCFLHCHAGRPAHPSCRCDQYRRRQLSLPRKRIGSCGSEEKEMTRQDNTEYLSAVLKLYLNLAETPSRASANDRKSAAELHARGYLFGYCRICTPACIYAQACSITRYATTISDSFIGLLFPRDRRGPRQSTPRELSRLFTPESSTTQQQKKNQLTLCSHPPRRRFGENRP